MHKPVAGRTAFAGSGGGAVSLLNALAPKPVLRGRGGGDGKEIWQTGSASGAPNVMPNMSGSAANTGVQKRADSNTASEPTSTEKRIRQPSMQRQGKRRPSIRAWLCCWQILRLSKACRAGQQACRFSCQAKQCHPLAIASCIAFAAVSPSAGRAPNEGKSDDAWMAPVQRCSMARSEPMAVAAYAYIRSLSAPRTRSKTRLPLSVPMPRSLIRKTIKAAILLAPPL